MRKVLTVALSVLALSGISQAAGPVYTIPADYEKMKKVVEGLAGTTNLSALSDTQARNAGANVKAFVEGATGKSTTSTYSPTYFRYYGGNYRNFVQGATGTDPGNSTNNTAFRRAGDNYRNFAVNATGIGIQDGRTYLFQYAGRNYRNLAQNLSGVGITDYRYYYYAYAGRNVRNLAEGQTGLSIRDYRYAYFRNAGRNVRDVAYVVSGYRNPATTYNGSWSPSRYTTVGNIANQFKQRADQTFYDTYINSNGLKKAFTTLSSAVTSKTAGMTPITRYNKAEFGGEGLPIGSVNGYYDFYPVDTLNFSKRTMTESQFASLLKSQGLVIYENPYGVKTVGGFWVYKSPYYRVTAYLKDGKLVSWNGQRGDGYNARDFLIVNGIVWRK